MLNAIVLIFCCIFMMDDSIKMGNEVLGQFLTLSCRFLVIIGSISKSCFWVFLTLKVFFEFLVTFNFLFLVSNNP